MIDQEQRVPLMALALSLGALAVPLLAVVFFVETSSQYEVLLWLLALVPAFLLAYYRGWRGAATGMAAAMAAFALTQVALVAMDRDLQSIDQATELLLGMLFVAVGVGWLAERLLRDRTLAQQLALVDQLTGLPNRRHVELFLHSHFAAAQRGRPVAVVLFDIDRFKEYNDAHGHAAGDAALKRVASVMHTLTRDMDVCGRWGGEEFLAVLTGADERGAAVFAERVRKRVETLPVDHPLTISAGIATYREGMDSTGDLIHAADTALYRAKTDGRNRVRSAEGAAPSVLTEDRP